MNITVEGLYTKFYLNSFEHCYLINPLINTKLYQQFMTFLGGDAFHYNSLYFQTSSSVSISICGVSIDESVLRYISQERKTASVKEDIDGSLGTRLTYFPQKLTADTRLNL